jgi:hypothetical protein
MELSEILGGAPAPVETAPIESTVDTPVVTPDVTPEPTTTVEQPAIAPRDERGRFLKQEQSAPEPVQAQTEDGKQHMVPLSAMLEERRKRQELEQRYSQQQQPTVKDEDFWQSPVQATQQLLAGLQQQNQQELANIKYQLAEDLTRQAHADYDSVRDSFIAKVHTGDPWAVAIAQQMGAQPNPAKFVYDQARRIAQLETVGDLQGFEERIRADERAKFLLQQQAQQRPVSPDVPRSLNSEPSASIPSSGESFEATPLGNLFERPF